MPRYDVIGPYYVVFSVPVFDGLHIVIEILLIKEDNVVSIIELAVNPVSDNHIFLIRCLVHFLVGHIFEVFWIGFDVMIFF